MSSSVKARGMVGKPLLIAVIGTKKSGKTAMVEYLVSGLTKRGFSVAAVKHVHHTQFTVDSEGKDSWRFARAGAKQVAVVSPGEIAIIEKVQYGERYLDRVINALKEGAPDVIVLEGFKSQVGERPVHKIITAHGRAELEELGKGLRGPILAYNLLDGDVKQIDSVPVVRLPEDGEALLDRITRLAVTVH